MIDRSLPMRWPARWRRQRGVVAVGTAAMLSHCGGGTTAPPPPPPPVSSVTVAPDNDTVVVAASLQLVATLRDATGKVLSGRSVVWASSTPGVATVDSTGLVHALALGSTVVIATSEGKADSATLVLAPKVVVTRDDPSLFAGDTTQLGVTLTDALGAPLVGGPMLWGSGDPAKATVNGTGVVTGIAAGLSQITASCCGGVGTQVVAVLAPRTTANREIAFLREHQRSDGARIATLWLMHLDGSSQVRLSTDSEYVNEFDWSWDGSRLLLTYLNYNTIGRPGTFVLNADGTGEHKVSATIGSPRWSPDGTKPAYHSFPGAPDVYVMHADGSGVLRLTTDGANANPVWSPDGRQIAFIHLGATAAQVGLVHADGSNLRVVSLPVGVSHGLVWSPDGKRIAFAATDGQEWLMDADGSKVTALCYPGGCAAGGVDWSPDGSHVALSGSEGVHILRPGDAADVFLAGAATPRWSPDGSLIVYSAQADTGPAFPWIRTIQSSGTGMQVLTPNDTTNARQPVWRP